LEKWQNIKGKKTMNDKIRSFRDLKVYQKAFSLQQQIFEITKRFPKEELFSLYRCKPG